MTCNRCGESICGPSPLCGGCYADTELVELFGSVDALLAELDLLESEGEVFDDSLETWRAVHAPLPARCLSVTDDIDACPF